MAPEHVDRMSEKRESAYFHAEIAISVDRLRGIISEPLHPAAQDANARIGDDQPPFVDASCFRNLQHLGSKLRLEILRIKLQQCTIAAQKEASESHARSSFLRDFLADSMIWRSRRISSRSTPSPSAVRWYSRLVSPGLSFRCDSPTRPPARRVARFA